MFCITFILLTCIIRLLFKLFLQLFHCKNSLDLILFLVLNIFKIYQPDPTYVILWWFWFVVIQIGSELYALLWIVVWVWNRRWSGHVNIVIDRMWAVNAHCSFQDNVWCSHYNHPYIIKGQETMHISASNAATIRNSLGRQNNILVLYFAVVVLSWVFGQNLSTCKLTSAASGNLFYFGERAWLIIWHSASRYFEVER